MRERVLLTLIQILFFPAILFSQTGIIKGTITDQANGETLIGATVLIKGTTKGTITDFDGNYLINNLSPGTYNLVISYVAYATETRENIQVKADQATVINIILKEATTELEAVKVVGRANRENEAMLLLDQKEATVIKESIGAQQLSSMGVSDAASATTKISGVTKTEGSGNIYVRGLGDRYLSTTMNGLPVPPDDIDKKNINLDLFSTDIINNVSISKTYNVGSYGDLTSGNVDVATKSLTKDKVIEIGIESGVNTGVLADGVYENFKASQNYNDISFLGYYSKPYETEESISKQSWNSAAKGSPINYKFSFLAGQKINLLGKELSILATASQSYFSEYREGTYQKYRMNALNKSFSDVNSYISGANITGLLNLNYDLNVNHSIGYNLLYIHKIEDELYEQGRNRDGMIRDFVPNETGVFVRDQNTEETQIIINQLIGRHSLSNNNELKWAVGYNIVNANEPNRFRNEVSYIPENDVWKFGRVSNFHIKKSLQEIKDNEINGYLIDEHSFINNTNSKLKVVVGGNFRIKNREFNSLSRGVDTDLELITVYDIDNMDEVLLDESLYKSGALRIDNTLPADLFDATLSAYAGYFDVVFEKGDFSGSLGLRYELDLLEAKWDVNNYFDQSTGLARVGNKSNTYSNLLPALNLKYQLAEKSAIRFAASKTLTLPEFKEISPFEYVSPDGDVTKGNTDLKHSVNYNADLKWELYPRAKELFSFTAFYKLINDPINLALTRGSSGYFKYDNTGDNATVYGAEIEARYGIIKPASNKPSLNLLVNATRMWFNQDLLENFQFNNKTESGLEGASEIILNGSLNFSTNTTNDFSATITANYASDKIYVMGAPESLGDRETLFNSEIIEKGFTALDIVLSQDISNRISIRLKAKNLLNPDIQRTQYIKPTAGDPSTQLVKSYKKGINLSLGIKIKLN